MKRTIAPLALVLLLAACTPTRPSPSSAATPPFGSAQAAGPHREVLAPNRSPMAVFSPAIRTGNLVFLSGQLGLQEGTLELVPGGITAETEETLKRIRSLLNDIGLDMEDVVKCTVFLADINDYRKMNEVYLKYFPKDPPARSALAASGLALGALVEIECIAAMRP
jgi:reactive intermediate/imine deaminase